jgi:hypothetical protein
MTPVIEEYATCPECDKPFVEAMGSCRGCGAERDKAKKDGERDARPSSIN